MRKLTKKKTTNLPVSKKREWLLLGVILFVTFLVYLPALQNNFTNWDDDLYVTNNDAITSISVGNINKFNENFVGNFHPLTMISLALDYHFFKLNPFYYHLKNIFFHLLNTLLVFLFVKKISRNNLFVSIATTLLFAIHPMHVESVAWVAERKDVLYTFYFLAGLLLYYEYLARKKFLLLLLATLAFVLSTLAKSAAVVFPVVLILLDFYEGRKLNWKTVAEKIPLFAFSLYIGLIAIKTQSQSDALGDFQFYSLFERIRFASYGLMNYLVKFIFPGHLSSFHPYPDKNNIPSTYNLATAATVLLVGYFILRGRKFKWLTFGAAFFLITIALVIQFFTVGNAIVAERYTYIPYIGIGFIYTTFIYRIFSEKKFIKWKYPVAVFLVIQLLYFSVTTVNRIKVWKNSDTLWSDVIKKYPGESGAYSNRGHYFRTQNNYDKALKDYNKAIQLDPKNYRAYSNRGKIFYDRGKIDLALKDFNKSLAINPDFANALANRGAARGMKKEWQKALTDLNRAIELEPSNANALKNRGIVFYNLKKFKKNIDDYRNYLRYEPGNADIISTIALCYQQLKKYDKALAEFNRAIAINPNEGAYYYNRSFVFMAKGDKKNALNDVRQAQQLGQKINENYLKLLKQ